MEDQEIDADEESVKKFPPQKWKCPSCGSTVTTYIPLKYEPFCANPKKHTLKQITMEKVK